MKVSRKPNLERIAWRERFGLLISHSGGVRAVWNDAFLDQLSHCKDDAARRLILGISERMEAASGD